MLLPTAILALSLHGPALVRRVETHRTIQMAESWDDLNEGQRERALRNYQHYMELPADKRKSIDQRYEKWKQMPNGDRDRARRKHDEYRGLGLVGD